MWDLRHASSGARRLAGRKGGVALAAVSAAVVAMLLSAASSASSAGTAQLVVPEASAPLQPQLLLGLGSSTSNAGQVLVSQDSGATWTPKPKSENTPGFDIYLLGSGQTALGYYNNVYDNETFSIMRSTDGGATWQVAKRLHSLGAPDLTADPGGGTTAAACNDGSAGKVPSGYGGNGVFVSHDGGATWKQTLSAPCFSVAIQPGGRVLLADSDLSPVRHQLWRSTNGGATWHRVTFTMPYYPGTHQRWQREYLLMLFDPSSPQTVIADGEGENLFRSTDAGRTWKHVWSTFTRPGQKRESWHPDSGSMNWSSGRFVFGSYIRFNKHGNSIGPIHFLSSVDHGRSWRMTITCGGKSWASTSVCALFGRSPSISAGANLLAGANTGTTALLELPRSGTRWQVVPSTVNTG